MGGGVEKSKCLKLDQALDQGYCTELRIYCTRNVRLSAKTVLC